MKQTILIVLITYFTTTVYSQASYEVMCRNKAKELAALTYSNCMTNERQSQIEQIRSEYKDELKSLKSVYGERLKKLSTEETPAEEIPNKLMPSEQNSSIPSQSNHGATNEVNKQDSEKTEAVTTVQTDNQDAFKTFEEPQITQPTAESKAEGKEMEVVQTAPAVEITKLPEHASEATMMNHPSQNTEILEMQPAPEDQETKRDSMAITLKSVAPVKKEITKKPIQKTKNPIPEKNAKMVKTFTVSKKASSKKIVQAKKSVRALPEKKIKTQSIDLNSPSEIAGTVGNP